MAFSFASFTRRLCALLLPLACLPLAGKVNAQAPPPPGFVVTHSLVQGNYYGSSPSPNEGSNPNSLIQGSDGFFYGTAQNGGSNSGTLFKVRSDGSGFAVVISFSYGSGNNPTSVVQGSDGALYGTSSYSTGSLFRINTDGTDLETIHAFSSTSPSIDGNTPSGRLVQGSDGYFYGATSSGGTGGGGTLFKVSPDGLAFIVIHVFTGTSSICRRSSHIY